MNIKQIIVSVAILSATAPVFAEEWATFSNFMSTKSRADVIAELRQAQADGSLAVARSEFVLNAPMTSSVRSRDEVRSEAIQSAKHRSSNVNDIYFGG